MRHFTAIVPPRAEDEVVADHATIKYEEAALRRYSMEGVLVVPLWLGIPENERAPAGALFLCVACGVHHTADPDSPGCFSSLRIPQYWLAIAGAAARFKRMISVVRQRKLPVTSRSRCSSGALRTGYAARIEVLSVRATDSVACGMPFALVTNGNESNRIARTQTLALVRLLARKCPEYRAYAGVWSYVAYVTGCPPSFRKLPSIIRCLSRGRRLSVVGPARSLAVVSTSAPSLLCLSF